MHSSTSSSLLTFVILLSWRYCKRQLRCSLGVFSYNAPYFILTPHLVSFLPVCYHSFGLMDRHMDLKGMQVKSVNIVACQRGRVSEELSWLRARDKTQAVNPLVREDLSITLTKRIHTDRLLKN